MWRCWCMVRFASHIFGRSCCDNYLTGTYWGCMWLTHLSCLGPIRNLPLDIEVHWSAHILDVDCSNRIARVWSLFVWGLKQSLQIVWSARECIMINLYVNWMSYWRIMLSVIWQQVLSFISSLFGLWFSRCRGFCVPNIVFEIEAGPSGVMMRSHCMKRHGQQPRVSLWARRIFEDSNEMIENLEDDC